MPNTSADTTLQATLVGEDQQNTQRKKQMNLFMHTVDKFVLLLRVYPAGHPLVENFAEHMLDQLKDFFKLESSLYVRVKATELLTENNEVFFTREESEREHFLWYVPAMDGLVSFEIPPDVSIKELVRFLSAISKASVGDLPMDDDTITLLWEYDLDHIKIHSVENYISSDEQETFGELDDAEALVTIMGATAKPQGEDGKTIKDIFDGARTTLDPDMFTQIQYNAETIMSTPTMPAQMIADAFRVDMSWTRELVDEWVSGDNLEYRLIESLISIVRADHRSKPAIQAIETISDILVHMLDNTEYDKAAELFELIRKREILFNSEGDNNPLSLMMDSITDPIRIEALIYQAQKYDSDKPDLLKLFAYCRKEQVLKQVLTQIADEKRTVLNIRTLVDILFIVTNKTNEMQWLDSKYTGTTVYFTRLLPVIKTIRIEDHQIVQRVLAKALELDHEEIKKQALELADQSWCSSLVIEKYIKPRMDDKNKEVRKLAIDAVRKLDEQSFKTWLHQAMDMESLSFRPSGEILFLLRFFIEVEPENINKIRDMLTTRGWFNEKRRTLATSVARVLLEHNDTKTIELMEKQAASLLTSPSLREDYSRLLKQFKPSTAHKEEQ